MTWDPALQKLNRLMFSLPPSTRFGMCPGGQGGQHSAATTESLVTLTFGDKTLDIWLCESCQALFYTCTVKRSG